MARGSRRYIELKQRLQELRQHLLGFLPPPPQSKTTYTAQELDLTRSYIVLAHAEIEAFCEDLASNKVRSGKLAYDAKGEVTPVLRRVISYHVGKNRKSWSEVTGPSLQTVESAIQSYSDVIRTNHGVKRDNVERLFYPLGIVETNLDSMWLAQMESFGTNRGSWAHKSIKALNPPDPGSELTTVNQLLQGLLLLDRVVSRVH